MLSLECVKQHLRIDDDINYEDELLGIFITAACRLVENHTRRKLVKEIAGDVNQDLVLLCDGDVKTAMLLLIGSWYANRESVVVGQSVSILPLAVDALLQPYVRYLE